jgi:RNA polymerase sigma factor (sigma-70 family)
MAKTTDDPILQMIRILAEDHPLKNVPDRELLHRFTSEHDQAAFTCLMRRHGSMVLDVCRNTSGNDADAEDAFQATFLILAQKAKSIRNRASVGSWLYGVAYRTALKVQLEYARRQKREIRVQRSKGNETTEEIPWPAVQQLIHAELSGLAECYRAPLVLCYLQGRTQDEAAIHLGVSKATLKKRLERGRTLLRLRLVRRGLGPAALVAVAAWPAATFAARLPPVLASTTVKAATAIVVGQTTAGLVSGQVTLLMRNGLKAMLVAKIMIGTAAVLAFALVPALGGLALNARPGTAVQAAKALPAPKPATSRVELGSTPSPSEQVAKTDSGNFTVRGKVFDIDGKSGAGAKLVLLGSSDQPVELGTAGADGQFTVTVAAPKKSEWHYLIAQADGAGIDFMHLRETAPTGPVELRLVRDNAIRGRVVTTEGKPVAGAKVFVTDLRTYADNSLDSFLTEWKKRNPHSGLPYGVKFLYGGTELFLNATTGEDGRFSLTGTGAERFVMFRIRGAGIAEWVAWVANRPGFDPKPLNQATADNLAGMPAVYSQTSSWLLDGPDLNIVVEPDRPIRGVVKDIETGKPRHGVKVLAEAQWKLIGSMVLSATTDADGRYEIRGARKREAYMVEVASDPAGGYMACQAHAKDTPGYDPITIDIGVKKGVIIKGRVIDASTNKPLPGFAMTGIPADNPFVKDYPEFYSSAWRNNGKLTGEDGSFRLVTIPGPVLLMGGLDSQRMARGEIFKYKRAVPDSQFPQYFTDSWGSPHYNAAGGDFRALEGNFCKMLQIKPGTEIVEQNIVVELAAALPVKTQDANGLPLAGTLATGISSAEWDIPAWIENDSCAAYELEPGKARLMVFYAPAKKLAGTLALKGDEKGAAVVKLGPAGAVKGRLVGEDGNALVGVVVNIYFRERQAEEMHLHIHRAKLVETDADGKFQIDEVIPGLKLKWQFKRGTRTFEPLMKVDGRSVQAGAVLDVGEVELKLQTKESN